MHKKLNVNYLQFVIFMVFIKYIACTKIMVTIYLFHVLNLYSSFLQLTKNTFSDNSSCSNY